MPELPSKPYVQPGEPLHDFLRSFWQRQIDTAELDTPDFRHPPLPLARIKKVMKSDPDVKMIAADAPVLFCKACEIFIGEITARAFIIADSNKRRTLSRADIAKALAKSDQFDFLIDIVPREEGVPGVPPHAAAGTPGAGGSAGQVAQGAPSGLGIAGGSTSGGAQGLVGMGTMGPGPAGGMVMGPGMGGPSGAGVRKREDLDLPTPTPMLPHQSHMRHHQSQPQQQPQHPHYTSHASHPSHISQHHHTLSHPHAHQHQLSDTRTIDLNLDVNVDDLDLDSVAAGAGARERLDENDNEALDMPGIPVYAHQHHQQQPHMDSLT